MNTNDHIGFVPADILLPKDVDLQTWSVVACDQYTSEPAYWNTVAQVVGDAPSALHITLPEIYLEQGDLAPRIASINQTMAHYLQSGIFKQYDQTFFYLERTLQNGSVRRGLIGAVDLEDYDYHAGATSLIRATEGTVLERIPPRVQIRQNAPLEMPHIMLLIDDPDCTVIEPLQHQALACVYDFTLMQNSGSMKGYVVQDTDRVQQALCALKQKQGDTPLLFAVGDGNHSLATAKECWERIKAQGGEISQHPARYALVEVVNIHDPSLQFEPIHRVVFGLKGETFLQAIKQHYQTSDTPVENSHKLTYVIDGVSADIYVCNPPSKLEVGTLQAFLDVLCTTHGCKVDYIHGQDVVETLATGDNIGFLLPPMQKSDLFVAIKADGVLPRKTFSMGHACDKRFYLECRSIQ